MFRTSARTLLALAILAFGSVNPATAQWETVAPGGETICSDGSPFRFFVQRGDTAKLLVEFEGGGGCWSDATCEQDIYNRTVTTDPEGARQTGQLQGIYDRSNLANPLRDFTHVYIPYCTGDLHWGNAETTYTGVAGNRYVVQHKGAVNAASALNWAVENVAAPAQVVVAGCSAGGYGAALWSARIAQAYPGARMLEVADSAAGVVPEGFFATPFQNWNVAAAWPDFIPALALDQVDPATLTLPRVYGAIAGFFPTATFSQFNTRTDTVQVFFYALAKGSITGNEVSDWSARMVSNVEETAVQNPNFRAYLADGSDHCIINRPSFYTQTVRGRRFSEWLGALISGADPGQVR